MQSTPFSDDGKTVTVTAHAGSRLAELFLIDHNFVLVDRGVGRLTAEVEPGVYKVKATLGEAAAEELVVLNEDRDVDLGGALKIASPAPLDGTGLTHDFHVLLAGDASANVEQGAGEGATVLIVSRRYSGDEQPAEAGETALDEVSLQSPDGETIVALGGASGWDPVTGKTVEVAPGPYRLRWRHPAGPALEQTVPAVEGWQTQVFLLEEAQGPAEGLRNKVSLLMSREGFKPDDDELLFAEQARAALADERKVSDGVNNKEFAKFDNPMLGLFGAHLMLLGRDALRDAEEAAEAEQTTEADPAATTPPKLPVVFEQVQFNGIVGNLRKLLGEDHPDVVALSTKATDVDRDSIRPIDAPPMLWRSWLLLIEASNHWPDLVPVGIWRETARVLPLRPFFVWSPESEEGDALAELEMARQMKRTVDEAAGAAASAAADAAQRELTSSMFAPRAAIEELIRSVS